MATITRLGPRKSVKIAENVYYKPLNNFSFIAGNSRTFRISCRDYTGALMVLEMGEEEARAFAAFIHNWLVMDNEVLETVRGGRPSPKTWADANRPIK